jgi:hypothetical protein
MTEEQRRPRALFNSTLRAAVLWANFRVPRWARYLSGYQHFARSSNSPKLLATMGQPYMFHNIRGSDIHYTRKAVAVMAGWLQGCSNRVSAIDTNETLQT